jgi:hypothetical protein
MTDSERLAFILRVLALFDDGTEPLWWRVDGQYAPITFLINCNDLFYWACADSETVTPANIGDLEQAFADAKAIDPFLGTCDASLLFCARNRKMRPQGKFYEAIQEKLWPLFDACGPERSLKEFGNTPRPK